MGAVNNMSAWGTQWDQADDIEEEIMSFLSPLEKKLLQVKEQYDKKIYHDDKSFILNKCRTYIMFFKTAYETFDSPLLNIEYTQLLTFINNVLDDISEFDIEEIHEWEEPAQWKHSCISELNEALEWLQKNYGFLNEIENF